MKFKSSMQSNKNNAKSEIGPYSYHLQLNWQYAPPPEGWWPNPLGPSRGALSLRRAPPTDSYVAKIENEHVFKTDKFGNPQWMFAAPRLLLTWSVGSGTLAPVHCLNFEKGQLNLKFRDYRSSIHTIYLDVSSVFFDSEYNMEYVENIYCYKKQCTRISHRLCE